jgi:hypothetical protein
MSDFVITGGAGIFAGASGDGTITGTLTVTGPTTESFSGTYVESIQTAPDGGSTFALMGPSVLVVFLARARKTIGCFGAA